jgi:hypothetical protein
MSKFNPGQHPRDSRGRFRAKGSKYGRSKLRSSDRPIVVEKMLPGMKRDWGQKVVVKSRRRASPGVNRRAPSRVARIPRSSKLRHGG